MVSARQGMASPLSERLRSGVRRGRRRLAERLYRQGKPTATGGFARVRLPYEVMAYFSDPGVNLYQIHQWLYPLERLNETHPVFILTRKNDSFRELERRTHLPVINAPRIGTIDSICLENDLKMAVYVNQTYLNFHALRYPDMFHVFLSHGESEKSTYMASNQAKAYDFLFIAGDAAEERIKKTLIRYDADNFIRKIGRPQLDIPHPPLAPQEEDRVTVLYAPTWEGDRPSMAYGSVESHGQQIVQAFTRSRNHRLIYRPHPRTGVLLPSAKRADMDLRALVDRAAEQQPTAGHRVDLDPQFGPQMVEADVMICDISAVAIDFLATGKPLIVTAPSHPNARVNHDGFLRAAHWLPVGQLPNVVGLVDGWRADDDKAVERHRWAEYYFGDVTPGASMRRFLDACDEVIKLRDELVTEKRERFGASDPAADAETDAEVEADPDGDA